MNHERPYDLHVFVPAFTPLYPKMANAICIFHTNAALARAAPNWLIDVRFTGLPVKPSKALRMLEMEAPPNLHIGRVFPKDPSEKMTTDEISQVLRKYPHRGYTELFQQWLEYWRQEVLGKRAVLYTRNAPFFRLFRELGVKNLPFFVEVHQLRYWRKVKPTPDQCRPSILKRMVREKRDIECELLSLAQKVFCISGAMERRLRRARPDLNTSILRSAFIPPGDWSEADANGVDLSDSSRDIDLLYTGQLYDWKGVHVIIEALRHCDPKVRLTIVGGNNAGDLSINKQIAEHLGVADRIDWIGHVSRSQVMHYQKRAKISVVPLTKYFRISKWYTSPIKVFELMAFGTPLLVADLPTLRDLLQPGVTAEFAQPNQPQDWGTKIDRLLQDPGYRQRLAENCMQYVKKFTYPKRGERIRDEIADYLANQPDPHATVQ